jgi:hypothetical protein
MAKPGLADGHNPEAKALPLRRSSPLNKVRSKAEPARKLIPRKITARRISATSASESHR